MNVEYETSLLTANGDIPTPLLEPECQTCAFYAFSCPGNLADCVDEDFKMRIVL